MAHRLEITVGEDVLARLDEARGHERRASFVKRALESALAISSSDRIDPSGRASADGDRLASSRTPVEKEPGAEKSPASAPDRQMDAPRLPASSRRAFMCRSCGFTAGSEKARCPRHGGALVPA